MAFKADRSVGYSMLFCGGVMIIASLVNVFQVFSGSALPPKTVTLKEISLALPAQYASEGQKLMLFSSEDISLMANMGLWYLLMGFLLSVGTRVCSLGIKLIKEEDRKSA